MQHTPSPTSKPSITSHMRSECTFSHVPHHMMSPALELRLRFLVSPALYATRPSDVMWPDYIPGSLSHLEDSRQCRHSSGLVKVARLPRNASFATYEAFGNAGNHQDWRNRPNRHLQRRFLAINEVLAMQAIIRTGGSNPITTCNDDPFATAPTCGWATDSNGNNIYASQGFCCSCTTSALAAATFTSGTNQRTSSLRCCVGLYLWSTVCSRGLVQRQHAS